MLYGWIIFGVAAMIGMKVIKAVEVLRLAKKFEKERVFTEEDLTQELLRKNQKVIDGFTKKAA